MFEQAVRMKLRFPYKGIIDTEQLWDLPVKELDSIYKTLNAKVKQAKEESLLDTRSSEDKVLDLQIDIIKHIVAVKVEEAAKKADAQKLKAKRDRILVALEDSENAELKGKTPEELRNMLKDLTKE